MNNDWLRQAIGAIVPVLTVLLAGLVANLSLPIMTPAYSGSIVGLLKTMTPDFAFMAIYFWRMVRPDLLSPAFVFLAGFLSDALTGAPLGMSSMSYLIAVMVVGMLAPIIVPLSGFFWLGGFAIGAVTVTGLSWSIASLWSLAPVPLVPMLGSHAITLALYPVVASILAFVGRFVVPVERP